MIEKDNDQGEGGQLGSENENARQLNELMMIMS